MELNRDKRIGIILGSIISFSIMACAGATFPYKGYPYDIENHKLIGDKAEDDLDDKTCLPREDNERPCIVILSDDYYKLKADYIKGKNALDDCQRGNPPSTK